MPSEVGLMKDAERDEKESREDRERETLHKEGSLIKSDNKLGLKMYDMAQLDL